jgi:hypothetical protein
MSLNSDLPFPGKQRLPKRKINYQEDSLSLEGVLNHGRLFGHLISDLLGQILKKNYIKQDR